MASRAGRYCTSPAQQGGKHCELLGVPSHFATRVKSKHASNGCLALASIIILYFSMHIWNLEKIT